MWTRVAEERSWRKWRGDEDRWGRGSRQKCNFLSRKGGGPGQSPGGVWGEAANGSYGVSTAQPIGRLDYRLDYASFLDAAMLRWMNARASMLRDLVLPKNWFTPFHVSTRFYLFTSSDM